MNRRALLRTVGLGAVSLAGCVAPSDSDADVSSPSEASGSPSSTGTGSSTPTGTQTPSRTPSTVTPAPDDPIAVRVDNGGPAVTVHVTVTNGETALLDETVELAADESRELDSSIDTTGEYGLSIDVQDGPEYTYSWHIEPYDVRMGSNAIARIGRSDLPEDAVIVVEE